MVREKPIALFAGSLAHRTELNHMLQGFRHSGGRERKLLGRCWDSDDGFPLEESLRVTLRAEPPPDQPPLLVARGHSRPEGSR